MSDVALACRDIVAGYGDVEVLHGVSLDVRPGMITALLGNNGAGKTTLMRTIAGVLPARRGSLPGWPTPAATGQRGGTPG